MLYINSVDILGRVSGS